MTARSGMFRFRPPHPNHDHLSHRTGTILQSPQNSWGKIKMDSRPVKVSADATLVFPLIVSQTFVKAVTKDQQVQQAADAAAEADK